MPRASEYWYRRGLGQCVECTARSDTVRCPRCKRRETMRRAERWEAKGLCACGRTPIGGKSTCQVCLAKKCTRQAMLRLQRHSDGRCTNCGDWIDDPDYRTCSTCRAADLKRRRLYEQKAAEERLEAEKRTR